MRTWQRSSRPSSARGSYLLSRQHPDGYWYGELEADAMLEADYIFLHTLLESGDPGRLQRALTEMMRYQNEDGSWSIYPGGPGNISLSVKCYSSAKLMGIPARRSAAGQVPRVGSGARRRGGVQHLHQNVSLRAGRVRLRRGARHSAGDCSLSQVVLLQYLRDFLLVALDSGSAGHHVRQKAVQEDSRRSRESTSCSWADAPTRFCACAGTASPSFPGAISFIVLDRIMHWAEAVHIRPLRTLALKQAEKWLLERLEMTDGLGAIYPAMLNAIIALRCLGYSEDDPQVIRARDEFEKLGIEEPASDADAGADLPHDALRVAGLGHGAGGLCAGRGRRAAQRSAHDQGRGLDALQRSSPQGRLGRQGAQHRARRLVLRVQQRVLSRHRRHRAGAAGAEQGGQSPRALSAPGGRARHRVGVRHAVQERRLGQLRQRQHQDDLPVHPLRGSQRHARSAHGGHYRAHAGDAGQLRLHARRQARREGHPVHLQRAGAGWKLVWPLGRELHLRDFSGAARAGRHRRRSSRAADSAGRRVASHGAESRRRLGRDLRQLRRSEHARRGHEHSVADGLGAARPAGRRRRPLRLHRQGRALAAHAAAAPTAVGTSRWARDRSARASLQARASPESFIWPTPCIASTSR